MPNAVATGRVAGQFGATQLVAVEVAIIAVATSIYALPLIVALATTATAVVLLMTTVGRYHGRWGYEVLTAWLRVRRRRLTGSRAARRAGPYRAELAALAPHLTIQTAAARAGTIGVGEDDLGWFAAIIVTPLDGLSRNTGGTLRLDWLARLATEASLPASTLQVVIRHSPLPTAALDPTSACALSYQELRHTLEVPDHLDVWIAVRLGLRDGATAAADRGGDLSGVHRALAAGLARISSGLTADGLDHKILDPVGLQLALVSAYGPDPAIGVTKRSSSPAHEKWSHWQATRAEHICFAVRGWPKNPSAELIGELIRVPNALSVNAAVLFGDRGESDVDHVAVRLVLRVVAQPEQATACLRHLRAAARRLGVRLLRLDGEHAAGVYATTPTGATIGLAP